MKRIAKKPMAALTRRPINEFLSVKKIAMIGISRNPKALSRLLFQELLRHGYDPLPVNPRMEELEGRKCCPPIGDIRSKPARAMLLLPREKTGPAVEMLPRIARQATCWAQLQSMSQVEILPAGLGMDAALYGCARLVFLQESNRSV